MSFKYTYDSCIMNLTTSKNCEIDKICGSTPVRYTHEIECVTNLTFIIFTIFMIFLAGFALL